MQWSNKPLKIKNIWGKIKRNSLTKIKAWGDDEQKVQYYQISGLKSKRNRILKVKRYRKWLGNIKRKSYNWKLNEVHSNKRIRRNGGSQIFTWRKVIKTSLLTITISWEKNLENSSKCYSGKYIRIMPVSNYETKENSKALSRIPFWTF